VLVFDYNTAVLREAGAWRYRGFTENPNTIAILAAAALPLNLGFALRATSRRRQAAWLAGGLLLVGSIIASESRGGLLAACAGTLLVSAFGVEGLRQRVAAITAVALVFAGGIALREAVQPPPTPFSSQVAPAPRPPVQGPRPHKSNPKPRHIAPAVGKTSELPREEDEIGSPALSKQATTTLASGRLAAWRGALELIRDRPILGYGFGTEQKVFVDRWYYFQGGTAENSYLGLLLQLGTVGLAFILALGCALVAGGLRAVRLMRGDERLLVLMELGVLVGAAAIMLIQSYLYSVGNVAADKERAGMETVLAAIGGNVVSPSLSGYRYGPPDCLAYHDRVMLLALQLCFDSQGRLIQAVDRRPDQPRYYSLEYKPSLSTIRFPRKTIDGLLALAASRSG
jgi:hypothetical protein